jgi:hypothetical protein
MEAVLVSDREAEKLHRDIYHCAEDAYRVAGDVLASVSALSDDFRRVHIVATWSDLIRLALWKQEPRTGDLFLLLRGIGVKSEDLLPFRESDIGDLFPWLYYGKRLDTLRRICRIAKENAERHLRNREARVHTHLVSGEVKSIVASSL